MDFQLRRPCTMDFQVRRSRTMDFQVRRSRTMDFQVRRSRTMDFQVRRSSRSDKVDGLGSPSYGCCEQAWHNLVERDKEHKSLDAFHLRQRLPTVGKPVVAFIGKS